MQPRIELLGEKKLIGKGMNMSLVNNKTGELWKNFMPQRKEISNAIGTNLYSVSVYEPPYFSNFNPHTEFEKWATLEVAEHTPVPDGMESLIIPAGLYAVFHYKGLSTDNRIFQYIFSEWLPNSDYLLDNRPHFEVLGEKYKNNDPNSEEEICIPIREK